MSQVAQCVQVPLSQQVVPRMVKLWLVMIAPRVIKVRIIKIGMIKIGMMTKASMVVVNLLRKTTRLTKRKT